MAIKTPTDSFSRPAALGNFSGETVPVRVRADGSVCVVDEGFRYELVKTLRLDLSEQRVMQRHAITFDSFAVVCADSPFTMHIGGQSDDLRCHIDKCLSAEISADEIYVSNEVQSGFGEIWFLKKRRAEN